MPDCSMSVTESLENLIKIQCSDGTWDHSAYMRGIANGLILSHSVITGIDPEFLEEPATYLSDVTLITELKERGIII